MLLQAISFYRLLDVPILTVLMELNHAYQKAAAVPFVSQAVR